MQHVIKEQTVHNTYKTPPVGPRLVFRVKTCTLDGAVLVLVEFLGGIGMRATVHVGWVVMAFRLLVNQLQDDGA